MVQSGRILTREAPPVLIRRHLITLTSGKDGVVEFRSVFLKGLRLAKSDSDFDPFDHHFEIPLVFKVIGVDERFIERII